MLAADLVLVLVVLGFCNSVVALYTFLFGCCLLTVGYSYLGLLFVV